MCVEDGGGAEGDDLDGRGENLDEDEVGSQQKQTLSRTPEGQVFTKPGHLVLDGNATGKR